ncbi:MAG: hypothetical protein HY812_07000 [Planctomycetes bacterium]|nr:hypothetical protein [Planctomycetota bacterium]
MRMSVKLEGARQEAVTAPLSLIALTAGVYVLVLMVLFLYLACTIRFRTDGQPADPRCEPLCRWLTAANVLWLLLLACDLVRLLTAKRRRAWVQVVTSSLALVLIAGVQWVVYYVLQATSR